MEKSKVSIFFLLLILCAFTWTIYSKFIKNEKGLEESFTEDEFIDFLYQNLGLEDPHDVDIHEFEYDMIETAYQVVDVEASDFQLKTMQNETIKLSDLKGKKVFINFWTSWCPPCKEEMPHLNEFYEQFAKKNNIEILAINITDQELSMDDVKKFADKYQIKFPILFDDTGAVSTEYKIITIPTSFIIDEEGKITEKIVGPVTKDILLEKFQINT